MPAVTHSQATRQNETPALIGKQDNSSNASSTIEEHFRPDTTRHVHDLGLFRFEAHNIVHQMDNRGPFSAGHTYATTYLQKDCLRGGEKEQTTNTFKKAISLPEEAHWKAAASKGITLVLGIGSSRFDGHGLTSPLRARGNDYRATELAMNATTNAQLWHRRLGHLNKRTLEFM